MNFSRKTILVVGAALLAACGDKVTVQEYSPPPVTAKVNSVEVTPATATLNVGQTITMTAAVNADAGLATTVTWSSSDATKASVSSAGVVTAVAATPGVAICATSTVDTGKKGCATVVVQAPPTTIPATVSINSITASGNLNGTVNPANVAGAIDVTLNVNPGNQTVTKVEVLFGGIVAYTQTFSAAQAAALRYAADEAVAAQTTFPQVVASINTACYQGGGNATCDGFVSGDATGAPVWTNGTKSLQAKVYVGSTTASASVSQNLTLNNVDGFHTTYAAPSSAIDAAGYRWMGNGALTVTAVPVIYSGTALGTVTATIGAGASAGCVAPGVAAATANATALTSGAYAIAVPLTALSSAAGCTTTNPNLVVVTATNANGDNMTLATNGLVNTQVGVRYDNVAPTAPVLLANPNGRANSWINDAVVFNAVNLATTATINNWITAASVETGIGGTITYSVRVSTTRTLAIAAAAITNATTLAPSATNATYCALAYAADVLGNTSANPAACTTFGVDRYAPTIAYTAAAIAANSRRSAATVAGEYVVTVNDTGLVGNSGMLPTSPVRMLLTRRAAGTTANSAGTTSLFDASGATAATAQTATAVVAAAPTYSTAFTGTTGAANHAYWTHDATAYDAAGNSASVSPRTMLYDATAPVAGVPSAALTLTASGFTANAFLNEDLDLQDYSMTAAYTGAPVLAPANLGTPWTAINGWNAATFANTNYAVAPAINLPLAIQANVAAGLTNLAGLTTSARSQSNLINTSAAFAPTTVTPGTGSVSLTNMTTFGAVTLPAGVTGVVTGNTTASAAATPSSAVLTITSTGPTAIYNNPFSRIDFFMLDATGARYLLVGSATTPTLTDNGAIRTFTWTATISGATVYTALNGAGATWASQVVALGYGTSNNIAMVNAALTAINVVF